tara:strand:- start:3998 stop:4255 length:258 start_codon:yes stop_codon:yes gene_type:complete
MGGIAKTISRAFGGGRRPKSAAPVVQQAAQPAATSAMSTPSPAPMGSGYGNQSTIMTSPRGLENEANIGRTVLGGGSKTERRRMM